MVWGCISAQGMGNLHICEGTINAEKYIQILEKHMMPSKRRLFHGRPCLFQEDNAKPHSAHVTTAQRRPRTVEQLKLYIKQEWERIPPENLQKLVSSVPKCLLNVIKRKSNVTKW